MGSVGGVAAAAVCKDVDFLHGGAKVWCGLRVAVPSACFAFLVDSLLTCCMLFPFGSVVAMFCLALAPLNLCNVFSKIYKISFALQKNN